MSKLKKFVARFDKVGKYENAKTVKEREITYWAYNRQGAENWFDREKKQVPRPSSIKSCIGTDLRVSRHLGPSRDPPFPMAPRSEERNCLRETQARRHYGPSYYRQG